MKRTNKREAIEKANIALQKRTINESHLINESDNDDANSYYRFQGEQTFESWYEEDNMSPGQMKLLCRLLIEGVQSGFEKAMKEKGF